MTIPGPTTAIENYTVLQESTPAQQSSLHYKSISTPENIDEVLAEVSNELDAALESDEIISEQTYALLNVPPTNIASSSTTTNEQPPSIDEPMQTSHYSVYNEQVNC
jgi:hypothetical protein